MKSYMFKHKVLLAVTVSFRCFGALMNVFISLLIQRIADSAIDGNINEFIRVVIFSSIFFIVMAINDYFTKTTQYIYIKNTLSDFKKSIFKGILRKDYVKFYKGNTAEFISNLTNDINLLETKYMVPYLEMVGDIVIFVATTLVLLYINVWITLLIFISGLILFIVPKLFGSIVSKRQDLLSDKLSIYTTKLKDIFSGYEVIKSYNIVDNIVGEFVESSNLIEELKFKSNHVQGISEVLSRFLGIVTLVITIALGGYFLIIGELTAGTLFAVVQLANCINTPIISILGKITMIKGMKAINSKLVAICNEPEEEKLIKIENKFEKVLELENVKFSYDGKINVLDNISTTFESGKKYAIIGKSGSGKSSLLKIILGYYNNYSGDIYFDGYNYKDIEKSSIRNQISVIHQNVYMFDKSIEYNIKLGIDFNDSDLEKAIENSGVKEFIESLPAGIESPIGENGKSLSGGQRQRIAIARSLIRNTPILVLDECTSALDNKTGYKIEDMIVNIEGLTVITVTHKLVDSILKKYDEIIVMEKGKIIEKGSFNELINNKSYFYDLYALKNC